MTPVPGGPEAPGAGALIAGLFPPEVRTAWAGGEDPGALYPEEADCVLNAVPARRREFTQGRLCARRLLREMGIERFPLLMRNDRSPVWPEAITGSLSHCGKLCAVALAWRSAVAGLGLDIETATPLDEELVPLICGPREIAWLQGSPAGERGVLAKLAFSIKESVFKCVYPLTGLYLDFQDCELDLAEESGSFTALLTHPRLAPFWKGRRLSGRFARGPEHLFTGIVLPAEYFP